MAHLDIQYLPRLSRARRSVEQQVGKFILGYEGPESRFSITGRKTRLDWGFLARHDLYIPARLDFTFPYVWRHPFIQPSNCLCIILSIYVPIFTSSLKQRLTYNKDDLGIIMNLPDSEIIIWSNFQVL